MAHGALTARVARNLADHLGPHGSDVLYDHGETTNDLVGKVGRIVSWFGPEYKSGALLAFLDIAVVSKDTGKLVVLIEIEETSDKPKVLLGDALATLLGDRVTFQGKRQLEVGFWTTLLVFGKTNKRQHDDRITFVEDRLNQLKSSLSSHNTSIDRIIIRTFRKETGLQAKLLKFVLNS